MNYEEALNFIHGTYKFGSKLGTDNIKALLNKLGNPDRKLKIIHVAGTNGKGSTSNMIHDVLMESGYKVGLFISPYLQEFTERIQINKIQIDKVKMGYITEKVKNKIEEMLEEGYNHPTEFEVVTAIGLVYFEEENVDFVVLEVGLGGRLDATNGIDKSLISVITSISYDHTEYLGNTLEEIAFEKAGIIKNNNCVVIYPQGRSITDVIVNEANLHNSKTYAVGKNSIALIEENIDGQYLKYLDESIFKLGEFKLALLGEHQRYNCATAIKVFELLKQMGYNLTTESIKRGLANCRFPGRFEIISKNPMIILDGGHNIDGVKSFIKAVNDYFPDKKLILFYGMLKDKHPVDVIDGLIEISKEIYTLTPNNPRAMKANELAQLINDRCLSVKAVSLDKYEDIIPIIGDIGKDDVIGCIGSLYLIGELRTILQDKFI